MLLLLHVLAWRPAFRPPRAKPSVKDSKFVNRVSILSFVTIVCEIFSKFSLCFASTFLHSSKSAACWANFCATAAHLQAAGNGTVGSCTG